jgi:hypothetical protein
MTTDFDERQKPMPDPLSATAQRLLHEAVQHSGRHTSVQFHGDFARTAAPRDEQPWLADLFHRGEVPFKLYLTLVMLTRKGPPHELYRDRPNYYFAEMLGYEDLEHEDTRPGAGTRRITRAITVLHKAGYVVRTQDPGGWPHLVVNHQRESAPRAPYITLPLELWSNGWVNVLSARALIVYITLRLVLAGKPDDEGAYVSPWERGRFHIKDDTWQRGLRELERHGLVTTMTGVRRADRWTHDRRKRTLHYLNNDRLELDRPAASAP